MYVDTNVYKESISQHICDGCLRPDEQETTTWTRFTGEVVTHTQQREPWHWWPDAMSGGYVCDRCGLNFAPQR
jgi:hypothetical protein